MQLKKLDITANSFIANGNKYLIHPSLSVGRMSHFEKLQAKVQNNFSIYEISKKLEEIIDLVNTQKTVQANTKLFLLKESCNSAEGDITHPALLMCSLFICRESDDLTEWSETKALENIEDWRVEGFDFTDFFQLAFNLAKEFLTELTKDLMQETH